MDEIKSLSIGQNQNVILPNLVINFKEDKDQIKFEDIYQLIEQDHF